MEALQGTGAGYPPFSHPVVIKGQTLIQGQVIRQGQALIKGRTLSQMGPTDREKCLAPL